METIWVFCIAILVLGMAVITTAATIAAKKHIKKEMSQAPESPGANQSGPANGTRSKGKKVE